MSLFSLKKTLSFSLSLSLSLSFFDTFWLSIRFFSSLLHFFSLGEIKVLVFSLFFPCFCWGDRKTHPFVSLSLLRRERFGKPDLPIEYSAAHAERGIIIFEKEEIDSSDKLARESRKKKDGLDFFSLRHKNTAATEPSRQRRKRIHPRTNLCVCVTFRPPPRGMPPKFILLLL